MILVDTSVWVDHIRLPNDTFIEALSANEIFGHPLVTGEIAMGSLANRGLMIRVLRRLPQVEQATHQEVLSIVERYQLHGIGLGYIDAHLLASTLLTHDVRLWTIDRRLNDAANRLGVAFSVLH